MNDAIMISKETSKILVDMWHKKGQVSKDLVEPLSINLANREHSRERLIRWADELRAWRDSQA